MELLLLVLSIALLPVYTFASGGVQFSHMVLALFILVRLARAKWDLQSAEVALLSLMAYVIVRECYAIAVDSVPLRSLIEALYIAFACLVLVAFSRIPLDERRYRRALLVGITLSTAVALGGIYHYGATWTFDEGQLTRSVGTFNNPNQLAYFAICLLSLSSLMYLRGLIERWHYVLFLGAALILTISAISKAGLIAVGTATVVAVAALLNRNRMSGKLLVFCGIFALVVAQLYVMGVFNDFYFVTRLEGIGADSDDNLIVRGYISPLSDGVLGLIFGMGETRIAAILGHEVHSTYWSFLLKYGLIGLTLLLSFWYQWTKRVWEEFGLLGALLIVVPASFYGVTHNGSRFAIFWVLVGLSFNLRAKFAEKKREPRVRHQYSPTAVALAQGRKIQETRLYERRQG